VACGATVFGICDSRPCDTDRDELSLVPETLDDEIKVARENAVSQSNTHKPLSRGSNIIPIELTKLLC
jgi:hypothetical protein